jgi:hypothetical protein
MEDKYKQLHLLIDKTATRLAQREEENLVLHAKVSSLESSLRIMESAAETAKALKEWKDAATSVLKKLCIKIDKEIDKIDAQSSSPDIGSEK